MTLEQLLETRGLDANRAVGVLDDVLAGLEAMHGSGIAHLDIKPSNVVLRGAEEAVLVDFGLAGKHIRPGCATGAYGAPEVWGELEGVKPSPPKVDVYAFGCVAFETLTGRVLFDSDSEMAQITSHMQHDGFPPRLKALAKRPALAPIAELLFSTLRHDPANRPRAGDLRKEPREASCPSLRACPGRSTLPEMPLTPVTGEPDPGGRGLRGVRPLLSPRSSHGAPARHRRGEGARPSGRRGDPEAAHGARPSTAGLALRAERRGALGALDVSVSGRFPCGIYPVRPDDCRIVEPGSPACLEARRLGHLGSSVGFQEVTVRL